MAYFAEVNENNIVLRVLATNNNDPKGDEGYQWLLDNLGGRWIKTSYNTFEGKHREGGTPLRKNYAGVGMTYDPIRDAFIPEKPFNSWLLNEDTCQWEPPIPRPKPPVEGGWVWNEETTSWDNVI